jgi:hypothetical protein
MTRTLEDVMEMRRQIRRRAQIGRGLASFSNAMRTVADGHRRMAEAVVTAAFAMARFSAALDARHDTTGGEAS